MWAFRLIETHAREDMSRAVWLARYTGQRQADVIRMSKSDIEDGGTRVIQQKTGKELWIPLHQSLKKEMNRWKVRPPWTFVQTPKGKLYDPERFRAAWTRLMNLTPAGAGSGVKAIPPRLAGSERGEPEESRLRRRDDRGSITGMSQAMIRHYSRFADQKKLAKAAMRQLERTGQER